MVIANNAIRLHTIKRRIIEDQQAFSETDHKSISTIDRILHRKQTSNETGIWVLFERNSEQVKNQWVQYVQVLSVTH